MSTQLHTFPNPMICCEQLTEYLLVSVFHAKESPIYIALSGGSTPRLLFELWATKYASLINWKQIMFFWVDERCVSPAHAESNYRMTYETLLRPLNINETQVFRMLGEAPPEEEAKRYAQVLSSHVPIHQGMPQLDVVLLGMGADGHTASIFPNQMHLLTEQRLCAVGVHPESAQQRITLTGTLINHAKHKCFLATGQEKKTMLQHVITDKNPSYPASHIADAVWYTDVAVF